MSTPDYDILIIGGGIYGCGIAQSAAASGYRTGLIEKHSVASGTSSQSTKLIHGGLRYLEQGNLKLVYEALTERERLLRLAPELVSREWFYIPVYRNSKRPPWMIQIGLFLYWLLSGGRSRFKRIPKHAWAHTLTGFNTKNLRALLAYEDAATDDALLTCAVAASAQAFGCDIKEQTKVVSAQRTNGIWQVTVTGGETISCRMLINAAGPWVNRVREYIEPRPPLVPVRLVQGTHLILDRHCPAYIYTESVDGRVMFFRPWYGKTLAGTTETPFDGDPASIQPTEKEIADILATWNHYFPASPCNTADITGRCCGLRVLPKNKGQPFSASRETVICCDHAAQPSYIAVYGGKLTTYRKEAEKVLKLIEKTMPAPHHADTRHIPLPPT